MEISWRKSEFLRELHRRPGVESAGASGAGDLRPSPRHRGEELVAARLAVRRVEDSACLAEAARSAAAEDVAREWVLADECACQAAKAEVRLWSLQASYRVCLFSLAWRWRVVTCSECCAAAREELLDVKEELAELRVAAWALTKSPIRHGLG